MTTPTVLLNHFYLTLDRETFQAIAQSEFLRQQFAPTRSEPQIVPTEVILGFIFTGKERILNFLTSRQKHTDTLVIRPLHLALKTKETLRF